MDDGCTFGIDRVCWISRTSGRSFGRFVLVGVLDRDPAFWRRRASGKVDRSDSSTSISLEDRDDTEPAEERLRRFAGREDGWAHSGTGFKRSNCLLNRFVYSLPLTISSSSFTRSFLNLESPASDIANRSSSLSSQAGASTPPLSEEARGTSRFESRADGAESRKKSFTIVSFDHGKSGYCLSPLHRPHSQDHLLFPRHPQPHCPHLQKQHQNQCPSADPIAP